MRCNQCGTPATEGSRFCSNCGAPLVAPNPTEGERKLVTVLFADVVGSTAMAERLDPEQINEIMAGAFAFMNAAVARYGGTVSRLMGDAILALFGAPVAHEDDPERAVRAALDIRDAAERYQHTAKRVHGVDFKVRVGLHTGLAVLATVGDAIRAEYTAMGDTPNVAARVQSAATPGTVLITASTLRHVRPLVEFEEHAPIEAKGKSQALEVYVVRSIVEQGSTRGIAGLRSPLVGRDSEMELLRSLVDSLGRDWGGALVVVSAAAGLAKTRLVTELMATRPERLHWLEGRAFSYGQALIHALWRDLLRTDIGVTAADSAMTARMHLAARANALGLASTDVAALEVVLGVQSTESAGVTGDLDEEQFGSFVVSALRRTIEASAGKDGCIVVFDDLHWADAGSLALIEAVAPIVSTSPVLLIATLRPERTSLGFATVQRLKEAAGARLHTIELQPLDSRATESLIDNLLDIRDLPPSIRRSVLEKSDGNPFFVEEVLRSFIDAGHIRQDAGGVWHAHPDIASVTIPETLSGVLTSRLDRLPERARRVIQTASVIGRNFPYPVLADVVGHVEDPERIPDPSPQLQTLTEEGLVQERAREPELDYTFKHALTRDAAYALLLLRRRRELHRRTGLAMEQFYAERTDELAPVLAHHFYEGDEWRRAARYAEEGALRAIHVHHPREAVELRDMACKAHDRNPEASEQEVCDAQIAWAEVAFKHVPREEVIERLKKAEAIARSLGDERRIGRALNWIGNAHVMAGMGSEGMAAITESFEIARRLGDDQLMLLPLFLATDTLVDTDPAGAIATLDDVIASARAFKNKDVEVHTTAIKADALARLGRFAEARATIETALREVRLTHSAIKEADVSSLAGLVYLTLGEPERAAEFGRYGAERATAAHGLDCASFGHVVHGLARLDLGQLDTAMDAFESAMSRVKLSGHTTFVSRLQGLIQVAKLRGGDKAARAGLLAAIENLRQTGDAFLLAQLLVRLAESDLDAGLLASAEGLLEEAIGYYRRASMRPALAHALDVLARVREAEGKGDSARVLRDEATQLSAEIHA